MINKKLALLGFLVTASASVMMIMPDAEAETCIPYNVGNCDPGERPFGNNNNNNNNNQIYNQNTSANTNNNSTYAVNNNANSNTNPQQAQDQIVQALRSGDYDQAQAILNSPDGQALQQTAPDYAQRVQDYMMANPVAQTQNQIQYPDSFSQAQIDGLNASMDVNNYGMGQILDSTMAIANDPVKVLQQTLLNYMQTGRTDEAKSLLNSSPDGDALKQEIPDLEQKIDSYAQSREHIEGYVANYNTAGQ